MEILVQVLGMDDGWRDCGDLPPDGRSREGSENFRFPTAEHE